MLEKPCRKGNHPTLLWECKLLRATMLQMRFHEWKQATNPCCNPLPGMMQRTPSFKRHGNPSAHGDTVYNRQGCKRPKPRATHSRRAAIKKMQSVTGSNLDGSGDDNTKSVKYGKKNISVISQIKNWIQTNLPNTYY